jgi:hypothetical protein
MRWEEEVHLLREEMRRIIRYLRWETGVWEARGKVRAENLEPEVRAGMEAYATKQADLHHKLGEHFWAELNLSLGDAAAAASAAVDGDDLNTLFSGDLEGTCSKVLVWRLLRPCFFSVE